MSAQRLLILHSSGSSVPVRDVLRACGKLISPVFVLSDADRTSDYGSMVERVAETVYARADDDTTIDDLGSLDADGVVTFDDAQVELADRFASTHGWRGRAMPGAFDKVVQRRMLNECGASRVHVYEIASLDELERARKASPHGVVKPRRSTMSNGVRVVLPARRLRISGRSCGTSAAASSTRSGWTMPRRPWARTLRLRRDRLPGFAEASLRR